MNYNDLNKLTKSQLIDIILSNQNRDIISLENYIKNILEKSEISIILFDKNLKILFTNENFKNKFSFISRNDSLIDFIPEEKISFLKELITNNVTLFTLELKFTNTVSSFAFFFRISINETYILAINDIENHQYVDDVYLFQYCLNEAPIGIIITNLNDKLIFSNTQAKKITNFQGDFRYGQDIRDNLNYKLVEKFEHNSNFFKGIIEINQKKFEIINKIININSNDIAKLSLIMDINEKYELQQKLSEQIIRLEDLNKLLELRARDILDVNKQLESTQTELQKALKAKDKFFSLLAHDLRSPFTALLGYTIILKDEFDDLSKDEIKYFIGQTHEVAQNTYNLLLNHLNFSRIQTGRFEFNPQLHKFDDIVNKVIKILQGNLEAKSINIIKNYPLDEVVYADDKMLISILQNIIGNAIKFSNKNSNITITTDRIDNNLLISVKDKGIGMDKSSIDSLFQIEKIFTKEGTNKEQGTGLGLLICKEFVEIHKGKIWVESEINKGTTFILQFPYQN